MLERLKRFPGVRSLYRFTGLFSMYHFLLAFIGALVYGFPSRKLLVIGVTGTKGKTTTANIIAQILESSGHKTGLATTVNFKVGDHAWINDTKQTMLGRFALQRLLRDMVRAGCKYAVIETSSEGILQHRNRFINYRTAVFTNLSKEHIERHGSFEKYRAAKVRLFEQVARREHGIGVYNLDDENVSYFLRPNVAKRYGYTLREQIAPSEEQIAGKGLEVDDEELERFHIVKRLKISNIRLSAEKTEFEVGGELLELPLIGEANALNATAAVCVAISEHIPVEQIKAALKAVKPAPGRLEVVHKGQDFTVIVDYAHEPMSLESVYKTANRLFLEKEEVSHENIHDHIPNPIRGSSRMICLLGSQGGGRDTWKRAAMGEIAGRYCDEVVLANEDPYDEAPMKIIDDVEKGVLQVADRKPPPVYKVIDRHEAIQKVLSLATPGDAVVLTGKGGEVWMCIAGGKKVPWDEKKFVEDELEKLLSNRK